ncbi:unnamed protein product [Caenorhabditis auriculariae]|uniref:Uncharacterized protein n=1 Tax=Caenorhabditis auriculariae TaxID=2777116 RepID=A0A8S1HJB0_9PELO|nr:unnamed protein product [Caenorhabditis auriculariae]
MSIFYTSSCQKPRISLSRIGRIGCRPLDVSSVRLVALVSNLFQDMTAVFGGPSRVRPFGQRPDPSLNFYSNKRLTFSVLIAFRAFQRHVLMRKSAFL